MLCNVCALEHTLGSSCSTSRCRMNGWQFHREMQADPGLAAVPVVVVSGWRDGEAAVPVPASRFLRKPFDPADLLALVARCGSRESNGHQ